MTKTEKIYDENGMRVIEFYPETKIGVLCLICNEEFIQDWEPYAECHKICEECKSDLISVNKKEEVKTQLMDKKFKLNKNGSYKEKILNENFSLYHSRF